MAYRYCKTTTEDQPLYNRYSSCIVALQDVVAREGGEKINKTSKVVDLDAVAQSNHPHQTPSTMDIAFCISEHKKNKTVNGRWCLVEFKYDVKKMKTLDKKDLDNKINGSKQLIGHTLPFHEKQYFVFSRKELGRNILSRISSGNPRSPYIPMTTQELLQEFF